MKNNPDGEVRPRRLTRDQLLHVTGEQLKEIERLGRVIDTRDKSDEERRRDLTNLLGHNMTTISANGYAGFSGFEERRDRTNSETLTWLGISFKIGELKADADFSVLSKDMADDKKFIADLQQRIFLFEHPERKDKPCECRQCMEHRGMPRY